MYRDNFGLSGRPFCNSPGTDFFVANDSVRKHIDRIAQLLLARDAVAVVTGGPGVGKSALVRQAQSEVGERAVVVDVDLRQVDADTLFSALLAGLGMPSSGDDPAVCLYRLQKTISALNADGQSVTAIVDIESMSTERAKKLIRLVNFAGQPDGQLNLILQGPHSLQKVINVRGMTQLRQRVSYFCAVRPFSDEESENYIRHQISAVGGCPVDIVDPDVPATAHQFVGGVPRLLNTLMDATLSEACTRQSTSVTAKLVAEVAQKLGWKRLVTDKPAGKSRAKASPTSTSATEKKAEPAKEELEITLTSDQDSAPDKTSEKKSSLPEMDPLDAGATGILKLEDLDERIAESVFGQNADMLTPSDNDDSKKKEAVDN